MTDFSLMSIRFILLLVPTVTVAVPAVVGVVLLPPIFAVLRSVPVPWGRVPRYLSVPMKLLLGYLLLMVASLGAVVAGEAGRIPVNGWTVVPLLAAYAIIFFNGGLIRSMADQLLFLFDKAAWAGWGIWPRYSPHC